MEKSKASKLREVASKTSDSGGRRNDLRREDFLSRYVGDPGADAGPPGSADKTVTHRRKCVDEGLAEEMSSWRNCRQSLDERGDSMDGAELSDVDNPWDEGSATGEGDIVKSQSAEGGREACGKVGRPVRRRRISPGRQPTPGHRSGAGGKGVALFPTCGAALTGGTPFESSAKEIGAWQRSEAVAMGQSRLARAGLAVLTLTGFGVLAAMALFALIVMDRLQAFDLKLAKIEARLDAAAALSAESSGLSARFGRIERRLVLLDAQAAAGREETVPASRSEAGADDGAGGAQGSRGFAPGPSTLPAARRQIPASSAALETSPPSVRVVSQGQGGVTAFR